MKYCKKLLKSYVESDTISTKELKNSLLPIPSQKWLQLLSSHPYKDAFHLAILKCNVQLIDCMLQHNPDDRRLTFVNSPCEKYLDPFSAALRCKHAQTIVLFLKHLKADQCVRLLTMCHSSQNRPYLIEIFALESVDVVSFIVNTLSPKQLKEMMSTKIKNSSRTFFHGLVKSTFTSVNSLLIVAKRMKKESIFEALGLKDFDGNTPLHEAAFSGCCDRVTAFLDKLTKEKCQNLLRITNKKGQHPLDVAVTTEKREVFGAFSRYLPSTVRLCDALQEQTLLSFYSPQAFVCKLSQCQMDSLTKAERYGILKIKDEVGNTVFHDILCPSKTSNLVYELIRDRDCKDSRIKVLKWLLQDLPTEEIDELLSIRDIKGETVFHLEASCGEGETGVTGHLLNSVSSEKKGKLLELRNKIDKTALEIAQERGHTNLAQCLQDHLKDASSRCQGICTMLS